MSTHSRGRRLLFAGLYVTEGAPIGFLWWALPTMMREAGGDVDRIGALLAFLVLPWAFKFLWAPLVDVLRGPRWGFRGWIVSAQLLMAASLVPLVVLDPAGSSTASGWIIAALVVHGFAAATQDVAIDGLAIATTPVSERGALNGWMQAGMLVGRSAFGGGGLILLERFGGRALVLSLIAVLCGGILLALFVHEPTYEAQDSRPPTQLTRFGPFRRQLARALSSRTTWLVLAFAATSGAAFEVVGGFAGPLLLDAGGDSALVGSFFLVPAVVAMLVGALAGGRYADRHGRQRAVGVAGLAVVTTVLVLALGAATGGDTSVLQVLLGIVYLAIGAFTAASYALFMDCSDPSLGATQFSAYMGATNLCEAWAVAAGGALAAARGYPLAFAACALVTLAALALVPRLRPT